jgi:hypothetical protein
MESIAMPNDHNSAQSGEVLVEFSQRTGTSIPVGILDDLEQSLAHSKKAMENAMATIRTVSTDLLQNLHNLPIKPTEAEFEFGIKFDAEAGAFVAKTSAEASISVKLTWK